MAAQKNTLKDLLTTGAVSMDDSHVPEFRTDDTPPPSDISSLSPVHSLPSSPEYQSHIKDEMEDDPMPISRGMLPHSRMALCMFMFAFVAINPFGIALNKFGSPMGDLPIPERRNILSCKS